MDQRIVTDAPYSIVSDAMDARERYDRLSSRKEFIEKTVLSPEHCSAQYTKIVIVIGESSISDHMSIFGYPKITTPFLEESRPYIFDALAPSNQTRHSLAMMLTVASAGDFDRFYSELSLVSQFRSCGYQTLWISNQGRIGKHDSFSTSLASEANETLFLNDLSYAEAKSDSRIVAELSKRGFFQRKHHVTFIHLMGSHIDYNKRYPTGFGSQNISNIIDEYDNSLLYTDTIISDLYRRFYDKNMLFIYLSDHGEVVTNERFGHGFFPGYIEEFRIPLIIWTYDCNAISKLISAIGDQKLNMNSFGNLVQFLVGKTDHSSISTIDRVSVLDPEVTTAYRDLKSIKDR